MDLLSVEHHWKICILYNKQAKIQKEIILLEKKKEKEYQNT